MPPIDDKNLEKLMLEVCQMSRQNVLDGIGGPFAAAVIRNGEIVSMGTNRVLADLDPTAHAEVVAIRKACEVLGNFQLDDCILITSCEPCPMCLGAIYWARPQKVYYCNTREEAAEIGFDDDLIYKEIVLDPSMRKIPFVRMDFAPAREAFQTWKSKLDKTEY